MVNQNKSYKLVICVCLINYLFAIYYIYYYHKNKPFYYLDFECL